tara:strand:+ start:2508 stop:2813 length:306 start_codon:yes stop_codon:yes gene_type:complete
MESQIEQPGFNTVKLWRTDSVIGRQHRIWLPNALASVHRYFKLPAGWVHFSVRGLVGACLKCSLTVLATNRGPWWCYGVARSKKQRPQTFGANTYEPSPYQ